MWEKERESVQTIEKMTISGRKKMLKSPIWEKGKNTLLNFFKKKTDVHFTFT